MLRLLLLWVIKVAMVLYMPGSSDHQERINAIVLKLQSCYIVVIREDEEYKLSNINISLCPATKRCPRLTICARDRSSFIPDKNTINFGILALSQIFLSAASMHQQKNEWHKRSQVRKIMVRRCEFIMHMVMKAPNRRPVQTHETVSTIE